MLRKALLDRCKGQGVGPYKDRAHFRVSPFSGACSPDPREPIEALILSLCCLQVVIASPARDERVPLRRLLPPRPLLLRPVLQLLRRSEQLDDPDPGSVPDTDGLEASDRESRQEVLLGAAVGLAKGRLRARDLVIAAEARTRGSHGRQ
uniref:Uncharacterized protein n=1 Tax=Steinernema glaseri TaxID=37863 RepID=A0A1I7Z591_9BILA